MEEVEDGLSLEAPSPTAGRGTGPAGEEPSGPQPSLFLNPRVPWVVRYGLPMLLWLDVGMILYANLAIGASVHVYVEAGPDHSLNPPALYNVTLKGSVDDLWNARAYFLSVAIAVFSGAWPHAKIVTTLLCWFLPESVLCAAYREALLFWTYVFNKYSHIETFVLVIMMAAFSLYMAPTRTPGVYLTTYVRPQPAFFIWFAGLMLSMTISRIALHYHRVVSASTPSPAKPPKVRRWPRSFWCDIAVCYILLGTLALFVAAIMAPSYSFTYSGLAGWVMSNICGDEVAKTASVISLGGDISSKAEKPGAPDVVFIQVAYLFFVVAAPGLCMALLTLCLMIPRRVAAKLLLICEVLYAWSAPDVLVVAMVASTLEMGLFVTFVIGSKCDAINAVLKEYFDKELDGDDKCLDISSAVDKGCWMLGAASVLFFVTGYAAMSLVRWRVGMGGDGQRPGQLEGRNKVLDWRASFTDGRGGDEWASGLLAEEGENGDRGLRSPLLLENDEDSESVRTRSQ